MNDFDRTDLRLMIQGLDRTLEEHRKALAQEGIEFDRYHEDEAYSRISNLQERLIVELARRVG